MFVTIDKRGSINLPASLRRDLGFIPGTHLELSVEPGGAIHLYPVEFFRKMRLNDSGLQKLKEARDSEPGQFPDWFEEVRRNAGTGSE